MDANRFNQIKQAVETTCRDANMEFNLASIKSNGKYGEADKVYVLALAQITFDEATEFLDRLTGRAKRKVKEPKHFSPLSFFPSLF